MKVGVLTGGGDCPGLNAVIRGVVRVVRNHGGEVVGLLEGWKGAINGNGIELTIENTDDIIARGGTILGSSRTNPFKKKEGDAYPEVDKLIASYERLGLDALIAIGGDDTLGVANRLYNERKLNTVGVPKTIDNDLSATDVTFGFDTCINIVTEAIDRVRTTAESHRRVMVVETMGREAGWIALFAAVAGAADYLLVPEKKVDIEEMVGVLKRRREAGKPYGIVVVSEGIKLSKDEGFVTANAEVDDFGHVRLGGVGDIIAKVIEDRTGIQTRAVTLGHMQRGGNASAADRVLSTRLGIHAARLALTKQYGKMVAIRGTKIVAVPLQEGVGVNRKVSEDFLDEAWEFFK